MAAAGHQVVLDTGAAHTHLVSNNDIAGLSVARRDSTAGALAAGQDDFVSVRDVRFGPVREAELDVVRVPGEQPGARDVLGMDVLGGSAWEVRLSASELWYPASGEDATPPRTYDLEMDDRDHSYVTAEWSGGTRARACWDTGAGITVVDESFR